MTYDTITKIAVIPALDQNGSQIAPGEPITFDPNLSRDPEAFIKSVNSSNAFRDPGRGKLREPVADIFPANAGGTTETATPPVVPPADGETGGAPVEEEAPVRTNDFNATAVIDGNVQTAAARIGELSTEEQIDAVIEAEKAKGNRTGVLEAAEARRAKLAGDD